MTADEFVSRLSGVQGRAPAWRAFCPAHQAAGKHVSKTLAVKETADGAILIKCHAGCSVEQVAGAVGAELHELFPPRADDQNRAPRPKRPFSPAEVARALGPEMTGAWGLLRKISRGVPVSQSERIAAAKWADRCEAILMELSR